jgi:hypothetical protein
VGEARVKSRRAGGGNLDSFTVWCSSASAMRALVQAIAPR